MDKYYFELPQKHWFLVADSRRAFVYERLAKEKATLRATFDRATLLDEALIDYADRPGRVYEISRHGTMRHSYSDNFDLETKLSDNFASLMARFLISASEEQKFDSLTLICGPKFLGMLRAHLPEALLDKISVTVNKDLTQWPSSRIASFLSRKNPSQPSYPL